MPDMNELYRPQTMSGRIFGHGWQNCVMVGRMGYQRRRRYKLAKRIQNPIVNFPSNSQLHPSQHTMANHEEEHHYHPVDAIAAATKATALTGAVGLFGSAVQNTLARRNVGTMGIFMRTGGTIGIFGMSFLSIV